MPNQKPARTPQARLARARSKAVALVKMKMRPRKRPKKLMGQIQSRAWALNHQLAKRRHKSLNMDCLESCEKARECNYCLFTLWNQPFYPPARCAAPSNSLKFS